jgi:prepilin-type N-terminal cleavage/methylation domain-containing protein
MSRKRAFTLIETLVSVALGGMILVITGATLLNVTRIFRNTSGRDTALRDLAKARQALQKDLPQAAFAHGGNPHLQIVPTPASLGGGADGDAVHFLSAVNGTTVESLNDGSGSPYFFENVIYYLSVPTNHDTLYGQSCTGGNESGYDYNCPHKCLIRVRVDENPLFDHNSASQDLLVTPLLPQVTRPTGFPKAPDRYVVAVNLLTFRVTQNLGELVVDLRAVSLPDAKKKVAVGQTSLSQSPFTLQHTFSIFPRN